MSDAEASGNASTITIDVPLTLRKRGGRKLIVAPLGQEQWASARPRVDNTLVKSIARAYRWQQMLKHGAYASAEDIAKAEKISASYVNRLLQLTLLSPAIVETVLDGHQLATMSTADLLQPVPAQWHAQSALLC
ncbi:MAG: hypothetical protein EOR01_17435 [Mesorhizobium sp.]|uniref:hypothetical protein n=1 Tax=Mesorhizobium sp. TaxID=1871066 RepID=UPI000FE6C82F|nr:hypothetical protein [Mesorhizobium sp.]RWP21016.1 MAG: hypothetical protein EOR01_17435 [Mesorhizobium sp.]